MWLPLLSCPKGSGIGKLTASPSIFTDGDKYNQAHLYLGDILPWEAIHFYWTCLQNCVAMDLKEKCQVGFLIRIMHNLNVKS